MKMIKAGYSGRGFNSPSSHQDWLAAMSEAFGSFYSANRNLMKAIRRADVILAPYGIKASYDALMFAAERNRRPSKQGKHVARRTMQQLLQSAFGEYDVPLRSALTVGRGFAEAIKETRGSRFWMGQQIYSGECADLREALAMARLYLRRDETDGVELLLDSRTTYQRHGITVVLGYAGAENTRYPRSKTWLVSQGERAYHVNHAWNVQTPQAAVREALKAWTRQIDAKRG